SSNGNFTQFGGFDARSGNEPGRVGSRRLLPRVFFSDQTPKPHSPPNAGTSPLYKNPFVIAGNSYFNPPNGHLGDGNYFFYNVASVTPALPRGDLQLYY